MKKSTRKTIAAVMAVGMLCAAVPLSPVSFFKDAVITASAEDEWIEVSDWEALYQALYNKTDSVKVRLTADIPFDDWYSVYTATIDLNGYMMQGGVYVNGELHLIDSQGTGRLQLWGAMNVDLTDADAKFFLHPGATVVTEYEGNKIFSASQDVANLNDHLFTEDGCAFFGQKYQLINMSAAKDKLTAQKVTSDWVLTADLPDILYGLQHGAKIRLAEDVPEDYGAKYQVLAPSMLDLNGHTFGVDQLELYSDLEVMSNAGMGSLQMDDSTMLFCHTDGKTDPTLTMHPDVQIQTDGRLLCRSFDDIPCNIVTEEGYEFYSTTDEPVIDFTEVYGLLRIEKQLTDYCGAFLTVDGQIGVNICVKNGLEVTDAKYADGTAVTLTKAASAPARMSAYTYYCAPTDLDKEVSFTVNGSVYTVNGMDLIEAIENDEKYSSSTVEVAKALGEYVEAADSFFDGGTVAFNGTAEEAKALTDEIAAKCSALPKIESNDIVEYYGSSMIFENEFSVRHYFSYKTDGDENFWTSDAVVEKNSQGYYFASINAIPLAKLCDTITVTFENFQTNETFSWDYSPAAYLNAALTSQDDSNLKNLALNLYSFYSKATDAANGGSSSGGSSSGGATNG